LVAADFKDFAFISSNTWNAIFIIIGLVSFSWSIVTIIRAIKYRKQSDYGIIIEELKKASLDVEQSKKS